MLTNENTVASISAHVYILINHVTKIKPVIGSCVLFLVGFYIICSLWNTFLNEISYSFKLKFIF